MVSQPKITKISRNFLAHSPNRYILTKLIEISWIVFVVDKSKLTNARTITFKSLCQSATKIGNFTIRQFSNRQKPIGKLTKRQSYKSATLPFGKSTIKQRGHSATLPNGNLTIRQLNKIANLLFGNFFNILAASKNVVEVKVIGSRYTVISSK